MTIDEAEKIKTVVENKDYIVQLVNVVTSLERLFITRRN